MYPYHNKIKQRIKNGEMVGYLFKEDYPRIGACLLLIFGTAPHFGPIRPHRYGEYVSLLAEWDERQEAKCAT